MEKTLPPTQHEELSLDSSNLPLSEEKRTSISAAADEEHAWTIKYVLVHHKKLVFWAFFWALCAVGWLVFIFLERSIG